MDEDEQIDQTMVTFGSIIAISDFVDQTAFLFSDGFLKPQVFLKNFVHKEQKKKTFDGLDNNSFYKCLFQVLPRVSDTVKTRVLQDYNVTDIKKEDKDRQDDKIKMTNQRMNEELSQLMNEYKQNIDAIDKSRCQKLTYHQPFQLLHIASGKFLSCHDNEAQLENQNYLIKLDDYSSDYTVFKIVPAYMYQSHGEQDVNAGEMCAITRAMPISNRFAYINCSQMEISEIKGNASLKSEHIQKKEINASVEQSHSWKIVLFQQYISENSRNLRVGDCIWLYHSEAEATLSVKKYQEAVDKTNFSFYHLSEWLSIQNLYVAITMSQTESAQGYQGSTNGLWQIEGEEFLQGGFVKYEAGYRLKNVTTGYYLSVTEITGDKNSKQNNKQQYKYRLTQELDKSTIFIFVDLKTQPNQKYLKGGSYTYLQNRQSKNWMDFQNDKQNHEYIPILKPYQEKTEHAVFKIHMATRNEVWEIQFLQSCFRRLAKFVIQIQDPKYPGINNFPSKRKWFGVFQQLKSCIAELENFVNNKSYTTSAEQQFGSINQYRQKLMREQFYIDILIKILERIITKGELEFYQKFEIDQDQSEKQSKNNFEIVSNIIFDDKSFMMNEQKTENTLKTEYYNYVKSKIELIDQIYQFLGSVCKLNKENQIYTYDLIPYFQLHTKYLPTAIEAAINIVSNNKYLLYKLSEDIKIEFYENNEIDNQQIKILINLYQFDDKEEQMEIKQHEKIIKKPVPLIEYFINLLWDDEAKNNSYYLKFLRNVCSHQEFPIQINQENIYKLYKKNNTKQPKLGVETKAEESKSNDGTVRLTSKAGQLIIPQDCDIRDINKSSRDKFMYIIEQLTFFSEVTLGRNYSWKNELGAQFEKSFLFRNIWFKHPIDPKYIDLQPGFARLALNLYIDQEPLRIKKAPIMCQLFSECDKPRDYILFKSSTQAGQSNVQELNTYKDLVNNLMNYVNEKGGELYEIMCPPIHNQGGEERDSKRNQNQVGPDILKDELILNTMRILDKVMKLNLIWVLDYSLGDSLQPNLRPQIFIQSMVKSCLDIFTYEKYELNLIQAHCQTERQRVQKKLQDKQSQHKLSAPNFMNLLKKQNKEEDDNEEQRGESQITNDQNIYLNPVMKGYLKLQSVIQTQNFLDPKYIENEIQLKIKICDFLEYLLDLRQDFMMQNCIVFFKTYILQGDHIENNPIAYSQYLQKENKKKSKNHRKQYEELSQRQKNLLIIQRLLKIHALGLLPNLAQTGIKEIDEPQKEEISLTSFTKNLIKINHQEEKAKTRFYNYINNPQIPEILDLDQYLSLALEDKNPNDQPVASLLPTFLHTFYHVKDKELEKRGLQLLLRLFTQKEEFKKNLQNMQVIFDSEKTILHKYITMNLEKFQTLNERLDIWISSYIFEDQITNDFEQAQKYLKSFYHGLKSDIKFEDNELISTLDVIDSKKQQLYANLGAHIAVINLLPNGLRYIHEYIMDGELEEEKKIVMIDFFRLAFDVLKNFCFNNNENQIILFEYLNYYRYMQYDLGQLELVQAIFQNNKTLLVQKVDQQIIDMILSLILKEGRQKRFLKVFESLMIYNSNYIFDNQILIQNSLLPIEFGEKDMKILYCDGSRNTDLKLFLDDPIQEPDLKFVDKLREIEYRDTFRDEPFYYHAQLLDILIQTTLNNVEKRKFSADTKEEDIKKNFNISVSKLKRLFTATYLLEILCSIDAFVKMPITTKSQIQYLDSNDKIKGVTLIKLQVIEFLRLVHISSERGQIQHSQLFHCRQQIIDFITFEINRLDKITELNLFTQDLKIYHIYGIFPFLLAYYDRFLKNIEKQDLRKDLQIIEKFLQEWLKKVKNLTFEQNILYPIITTNEDAKLLIRCLQTFCKIFYEKTVNQKEDPIWNQVKIKLDSLQEADQDQSKDIIQNNNVNTNNLNEIVGGYHSRKSSLMSKQFSNPDEQLIQNSSKKYLPEKKKISVFSEKDDECDEFLEGYDSIKSKKVENIWKLFLKELLNKDQFLKEAEKERETIANAILNISSLLKPEFSKNLTNKPDVKSISRKLISYLQSAFSDPNCKGSIQTLLHILKKIIDTDQNRKVEMQNLFDKLGATQMVLLVLSENNSDKKLMMSFLQFINTLLDGGNDQVQGTIYSFMMSFSQSENIFQKIYFIIRKQIENLEILSKSKGESENESAGLLQIDYNEFQEDLSLVLEVLTFLQNAVEGHYRKLQNYFREQTNSKNNYDLTNAITDLFKTYYYDGRIQKNYDNMLKCLDTLNELVQGPCQDNQKAISESKFLDIAADLFSQQYILSPPEEIEQIGKRKSLLDQPLQRWQICRLMNKILNLIMSLLEGSEINQNNPILKRIMRNLPINLLEKHCVNEYNKYVKIYGDKYEIEALEHLSIDPFQLRKMKESKYDRIKDISQQFPYFETILQNGFLLFFLMSYYMECDPYIVSPIIKITRMHKKKILKTQTSNEVWQIFKDSFVYMLIQFTIALIRNLFGTLNSMKNLATDQFKVNQIQPDMSEEEKQRIKEEQYRKDLQMAINFYLENSAHIDVMHDDNLEVVYFIKLPSTNYLPKEQKILFHDQVDRSTTQSKVQGLMNIAPTLIEVCKHEEYLKRLFDRQKYLALLTDYVKLWRELAFFLTLFLNLFILFSFDGTVGDRVQDYIFFSQYQDFNPVITKTIIYIIGIVMTGLSLFVVSFYLLKNAPLILKRAWLQKGLFDDQDPNPLFILIDMFYKFIQTILSFLQEVEVMYYIAYGLFAILGTFYHPLFFIFHLTEILFRYPTLKNIILSVYRPRTQLILTFFLLFLLVYVFTIFAYWRLSNEFAGYCDTLLYCFMMNIEWTFRGSIGDYVQQELGVNNVARELSVGRFFFDEVSNIILGVIMLNIVAGIIIDTFGSLREEEGNKLNDMVDNCFICGNLKADFDRLQSKSNGGFREHIKINHYMWNYVYFFAYLRWKEKTEYSGIESYVDQKLKEEDLCWVPFNQARELIDLDGIKNIREKELIQKIEEKIVFVQEQIIDMGKLMKVELKKNN
ncbi:unnamed protein product [Paramecium pentaurelia]|uniref:MIR domain protein n=1 Tax=Paramecium pentaurelia TaxID=43138 RepID=A0A8S1UU93_9CILI|nr:unnamed protein product [Paramecium pentaurelia]